MLAAHIVDGEKLLKQACDLLISYKKKLDETVATEKVASVNDLDIVINHLVKNACIKNDEKSVAEMRDLLSDSTGAGEVMCAFAEKLGEYQAEVKRLKLASTAPQSDVEEPGEGVDFSKQASEPRNPLWTGGNDRNRQSFKKFAEDLIGS